MLTINSRSSTMERLVNPKWTLVRIPHVAHSDLSGCLEQEGNYVLLSLNFLTVLDAHNGLG